MAIDSISNVGAPAPLPRDPGLTASRPTPLDQDCGAAADSGGGHPGARGREACPRRRLGQKGELQNVLKKLNEFVGVSNTDIQFTLDDETGVRVVKVVDRAPKGRHPPDPERGNSANRPCARQIAGPFDPAEGLAP